MITVSFITRCTRERAMGKTRRGRPTQFSQEHAAAMHQALERVVSEADAIEAETAAKISSAFQLFVRDAKAILSTIKGGRR
jgi:hypothetical protein